MRCSNASCQRIIRYPGKKNRISLLCGICAKLKKSIRSRDYSELSIRQQLTKHDNPDNNFKLDAEILQKFDEFHRIKKTGASKA
tara:strand:+ start:1173 stop:1424 length:252 start_codon:yes stop_codon:yes gene_type:complete